MALAACQKNLSRPQVRPPLLGKKLAKEDADDRLVGVGAQAHDDRLNESQLKARQKWRRKVCSCSLEKPR